MKTCVRVWMSALVVVAVMFTMVVGVAAERPAQQRQATPTASTQSTAGGPGAGQQMTLMKAEVNKTNVAPGEEVRFLLQIKSTGTRELDGPRVIYEAPAGIAILSATSTRGKIINVWEKKADVDVVNLMYNDTVDITIVARVKPDAAVGSVIVNTFQIHSAYAGSQQARLGLNVVAPGAKPAAVLPKTGGGIFLLILGVVLAVAALALRGVRARREAA